MLTIDERPIIALSTPKGSGAIALIRISGHGSIEIVDKISTTKLSDKKTHTIHHANIKDENNRIIDEVLLFLMKSPKTFTGQDTVEISCHNNEFIINKIIDIAIKNGAHNAQRGEFTKRAFLNKKIDLIQAESIHEIIQAQTEESLKKSLSQLKGTLSSKTKEIEDNLVELLAITESSFEFLEEEQKDIDLDNQIRDKLKQLIKKIKSVTSDFSKQKQIRQGTRISILGSVNAGKSTLFNSIIKDDKSIVTDTPGTTRNCVESTHFDRGQFYTIVDTAGLRETNNEIEKIGINRAWKESNQSDIILLVLDATKKYSPKEIEMYESIRSKYTKKTIIVENKTDRISNKNNKIKPSISVSAKNNTGIEELKVMIEDKRKKLFDSAQSPFLLNQRQHNLLIELCLKLNDLEKNTENNIEYELVSYRLKDMLELTSQITGKTVNKKMLDTIFSSFCIGK